MTDKINDGGPAFPDVHEGQFGMSLRDWFAGQALAGLLANDPSLGHLSAKPEAVAEHAYDLAREMIRVREGRS